MAVVVTYCEACDKDHDITTLTAMEYRYEDTVLPGRIHRTPVLTEESREAFEHWMRTDDGESTDTAL
jgi:hypothetical protein